MELIEVDAVVVTERAQRSNQSAVRSSGAGPVPFSGLTSVLDTMTVGFTGRLGTRALGSSVSVAPLGPAHLAKSVSGTAVVTAAEDINTAATTAVSAQHRL